MFCFKCGSEIEDGEKFCSNCGQSITKDFVERKASINIKKNKSLPIFLGWILTIIGGFSTWGAYYNYSYVNDRSTWYWRYEEVQNAKIILTGSVVLLIAGIILLLAGYYLKANSYNEKTY